MSRFGSIGTQYFDDAGAPLIGGKINFYEPGQQSEPFRKNTFADVGLSIPNPNPVPLSPAGRQPNIFFSGSARAVLTADSGQIEVRDPVGGDSAIGAFSDWNAETIFNIPDIVVGSDGNFYISITDGNASNDPTGDPVNWTQIRFIRVWNTNEVYTAGQIVEGPDGLLYTSLTSSNTGNNPTTDVINWGPATVASIPAVIRAASKTFAYRNL